jgi:hypothetical protein
MKAPTILGKRMRRVETGYEVSFGGIELFVTNWPDSDTWEAVLPEGRSCGKLCRNQASAARALEHKLIQLHAELGKRIGGGK